MTAVIVSTVAIRTYSVTADRRNRRPLMRLHARFELEHGKTPEMKAMAKKIIAAQKKEIAEFDQWMHMHP